MSIINPTDPDFRICRIGFDTLLEIQSEAEEHGWATRWSSTQELRNQVEDGAAVLQSLTREERGGTVRAYRCLLLFSTAQGDVAGGITTVDLEPARYMLLERLDQDPAISALLAHVFSLALGGISPVTKA
jgi:hypothetical protein